MQYSTSIIIVRLRSNYGKGSLQYSTVQYSTVRYGSINRQVSTHRDQCNQVGSIYRDAHVLELDNRVSIRRWTDILYWHIHVLYSTVQYSTVQYGSINMQVSTHRDQCTLVGSIYRDAHVLELDNRAWISEVQNSTVQYRTVQYSTVQYSMVRIY